jgi:hypothetical protein
MNKTIKLTQSELTDLVKRVIKENVNSVSSDGYGMLNKNQQGDVTEDMAATSGSASNSFTSFLVQQGFKDWSGGKPASYGMNFHYISRKPKTPANLSCSVGQETGQKGIGIDISFDGIIERAERYKTSQEFMAKSAIPKIEKLAGKDFDWNNKTGPESRFTLSIKNVPVERAIQIIKLYNQIKMVGPYSQVKKPMV